MAATLNFRRNLQTAIDANWGGNQTRVALAAGVSRPYLNRVLKGKTTPAIDQCERLAKAAGFPLVALLGSPEEFSETVLTAVND